MEQLKKIFSIRGVIEVNFDNSLKRKKNMKSEEDFSVSAKKNDCLHTTATATTMCHLKTQKPFALTC